MSIATRPIYDLLAADGSLAQLRAAGYRVEGPCSRGSAACARGAASAQRRFSASDTLSMVAL